VGVPTGGRIWGGKGIVYNILRRKVCVYLGGAVERARGGVGERGDMRERACVREKMRERVRE